MIKCPHCEGSIDPSNRKYHIDHEVEIVHRKPEIYDTYVCPHCKGYVGLKMTGPEIQDNEWEIEVELL